MSRCDAATARDLEAVRRFENFLRTAGPPPITLAEMSPSRRWRLRFLVWWVGQP